EYEPPLAGWLLGRVAEHPPRRPAAESVPDLLGRRMTDRESDRLLGFDQRLLLVDRHPPARGDAEQADRAERDRRPGEATVDERRVGASCQVDHETDDRQREVEVARDAAARVV